MPVIKIPYDPQPHQLEWHNCETRFLVAVCGRQIGKTTAAVNELIKRAITNKNTRNWYVTNDYRQAKRNVWSLLQQYLPKEAVKSFNTSELTATLTNNSKIELIGVENAERLRGAVVHFIICDEYADFSRDVWAKVLRPMLSTTEGDVWFIGTPKGMGNDLYDRYYSKSRQITKYRIPSCTIHNKKVQYTTSKYASLRELQDAYKNLPIDAFNQEYMAEFTRPAGVVYGDWPLDNFKEMSYDPHIPLHLSFDFGVNDPTAIIWIQPYSGEFRVIDYYEASNGNVDHFVQVIKSKPYREPSLCTGDDAGRSRTLTTGTSPIDEFSKQGIHISTLQGLKIPNQIRMTHKHIKSLFVSDKLVRFRDCLLNYHYPEVKDNVRDQSNEKPVHDEWSHAMRALEYYFANYRGETVSKFELPQFNNKQKWAIK